MAAKDPRDWSTDLLIAGVGLIVGVVIGIGWKGLPAANATAGIGMAAWMVPLFVICHFDSGDPTAYYTGRLVQLLLSVTGGLTLMALVHHP